MQKNKKLKGLFIFFTLILIFSIPEISKASEKQRVAVTSDIVNVRSGPDVKKKILWQVEKYHPFVITKKKGKWCEVRDFENDTGWVHRSLLKSIKCVITKRDKCNVRSRPDLNSEVIFTVDRGVPFNQLKKQGKWIKIKHASGSSGWIYKTLVW